VTPHHFKESNKVLGKPSSMSDEECAALPIYTNGAYCVSCWDLTDEDIANIVKMRKLWVYVWSGTTQPPICPQSFSPFAHR
jgi:hypothetical protein